MTPDYLSDISDIPISKRLAAPTGHTREGTQRLRQILQMGPITCPDRFFMDELNGVWAPVQPSRVVDLTEEEDATAVRMVGHPNKFGCEEAPDKGSESSGSATPPGEPIQSCQRGRSRPVRINSILVYRMADMEMVDRAGGCPIYMMDYFTSAVTPKYLEPRHQVSGVLPNWTTSAFSPNSQAGVPETEHCSHAVERQCLSDLEKLLSSLGKVFMRRVVVQHVAEPIPDEDNFLVDRVILLPRLPENVFRWLPRLGQELQAPMVLLDGNRTWSLQTGERIEKLREKADTERNQNQLLANDSLAKYKWFGSSSTSGFPHDQSRSVRSEGEVIIVAPILDPAVHYCARIVVAVDVAGAYVARSEVLWGVSTTSTSEPTMADQGQRGTKRPNDHERTAWLQQKFSKGGDSSKTRLGGQGSGTVSGVSSDPPAARVGHTREEQPASTEQPVGFRREDVTPRDPLATITGAEPIKRKLLAPKVVVAKFDDRLTSKVAESFRHSNHIRASEDMIVKLVNVLLSSSFLYFVFPISLVLALGGLPRVLGQRRGPKPLQPYGRQSGQAGLVVEVKKWLEVEKLASEKVSKPRSKRSRLRRRERGPKAATDYENSLRFKACLLAKYKEGMKDMKANFILANPTLIGLNWSFMPEISRET
ncbi:hypothetical protein TIFTF001_044211 [Ficus carica]|uniref:Uncharacterized protein n=1 Tax=Ficus carica TaxID=3494 RepID=A0AA88CSR6_FICCA|nr:hypothetical protein TIFTF001_044211 [Ficus carica]